MLWEKSRMKTKDKIINNLRTIIYALLLVYCGFFMLTTSNPVWFALVTMLSFNLVDELDKW